MKFLNFLVVLSLATVGCEQRGNSTTTIEPAIPAPPASEPGVFARGVTYSTDCLSERLEVAGMKIPSSRKTYLEQDGGFSRVDLLYVTEGACDDEIAIVTETGAVKEIGNNESELVYDKTTVALKNDLAVAAFNQAQVCGFTDWELNIERDISMGTSPCFAGARPRSEHQVMFFEGSKLFFGESPEKIDKRVAYSK